MRVAARAHPLTIVVHAVEDAGAVCGARPRGRWRLSENLPVSCPRCLLALSHPRYAQCVQAGSSVQHVRAVGDAGFRPRDPIDTRALCGGIVSQDVALLPAPVRLPADGCPACEAAVAARREPV